MLDSDLLLRAYRAHFRRNPASPQPSAIHSSVKWDDTKVMATVVLENTTEVLARYRYSAATNRLRRAGP